MKKHLIRLRSLSFVRLFFIGTILTILISYISIRKLIYIPNDIMMQGEKMTLFADRVRKGLEKSDGAKRFTCKTKDNIELHGLYIERINPQGTILLCHGYRCCKELTSGYTGIFKDYNIVMFDFRSHGENKKSITTIGCHEYKDVLAVSEWIKTNKPNMRRVPLAILGVSMGGAAALHATEKDPTICDALVIDSSFSNLQTILDNTFKNKSGLPSFPFLKIMKVMFNYLGGCDVTAFKPLEAVKKIKKPIMLIHSCIDPVVPVQESLLMYAQGVKKGAKLWIAPECKHGWLHKKYPELYKKKVKSFLNKRVFKNFSNNFSIA